MARGRGRRSRGIPHVFPTHDPDGYPLPDANCAWYLGIAPCIIGLILIIVGSVVMSDAKKSNRNWEAMTGMAPTSSGNGFIGMIVVGAIFVALGAGCAVRCRYRNQQNFAEWVRDYPDAARALEARGGYDAVPLIIHPDYQQQATSVQVIVVQSNAAAPEGPPGYSYPAGGGTAGAPIVQNGMLVYPQEPQQQPPSQQQQVMTVVAAPTGGTYFYKPEFRGQRLTPEQMAPSIVIPPQQQQQQQPTMLMVQPGAVVGQPVVMGGGDNNAAKPPHHFSYTPMPPTPAAAGIPGFGLPN